MFTPKKSRNKFSVCFVGFYRSDRPTWPSRAPGRRNPRPEGKISQQYRNIYNIDFLSYSDDSTVIL